MEKRRQTIAYAGAIVIGLLLINLVFTIGSNTKNKKSLITEKLASEKLLSEKLSLEKKLAALMDDYTTLTENDRNNSKLLAETKIKIAENEKKINSITSENRSLRATKKELAEIQKVKSNLEKESAQLKSGYEQLMAQSRDLQNSVLLLGTEKKNLVSQLENAGKNSTDNFLVTATRGKKTESIVVKASRTKNLNVTFEVPQSLTEAISFRIVTPSGTIINPEEKILSWNFPQEARNFTASLSTLTGEFEQSRQVVMNYTSPAKLGKGEYKIQILCDGNSIGNCRILLR